VVPLFDGDAPGFEIETFMSVRTMAAGLAVAEVPSFESERVHGASNLYAVRDGLRVLRTVVSERLRVRAQRRALGVAAPQRNTPVIDLTDNRRIRVRAEAAEHNNGATNGASAGTAL
jgi:hypothetical protein